MQKVFKVPVNAYDIATGELVPADRYIHGQPMEDNPWQKPILIAQRAGRRITHSYEWSGNQRYQQKRNPEFEERFIGTAAWTDTVLDFDDETLKEGITLNDDGTIKSAKVVLGRKDGIVLPHESKYVADLPEVCMPLVAYLQGVKYPKRELPDAFFYVVPSKIRPVGRGDWYWPARAYGRVAVAADFDPAVRGFAAWLIDEEQPGNIVTPAEYEALGKV